MSRGSRDRRPIAVAAAVLGIGALAVVVAALVSAGTGAPAGSPSPIAAAASPSPTAEPSPTEDVFPNAAEAALLALLPDDLAGTCSRGQYDPVDADPPRRVGGIIGQGGSARTPLASVSCAPDFSLGVNSMLVRQFNVTEGGSSAASGGALEFNTESVISARAIGRRAPAGDCAASTLAISTWSTGNKDQGAIFCYVDGASGDAVLLWSYQDAQILVLARNSRGDSRALYAYFTQNARFVAP